MHPDLPRAATWPDSWAIIVALVAPEITLTVAVYQFFEARHYVKLFARGKDEEEERKSEGPR